MALRVQDVYQGVPRGSTPVGGKREKWSTHEGPMLTSTGPTESSDAGMALWGHPKWGRPFNPLFPLLVSQWLGVCREECDLEQGSLPFLERPTDEEVRTP